MELTKSVVAGSAIQAGASGFSTGMWTLRLWDTRLVEASLIGVRDSAVVYQGLRSRASPMVDCGGRRLACRTFMYDSRGLSTSKACPKGCQVV